MTTATHPVQLTAKLYAARDAMKFLFGDRYAEKVAPIVKDLRKLASQWGLAPTETMLRACSEIEKDGASGVDLAMVIAAYVEDVEGTLK